MLVSGGHGATSGLRAVFQDFLFRQVACKSYALVEASREPSRVCARVLLSGSWLNWLNWLRSVSRCSGIALHTPVCQSSRAKPCHLPTPTASPMR